MWDVIVHHGTKMNIQNFQMCRLEYIPRARTYQSTLKAAMAQLLRLQQSHFFAGSSFPLSNDQDKCATNPCCCGIGLLVVVLGVVSACARQHLKNGMPAIVSLSDSCVFSNHLRMYVYVKPCLCWGCTRAIIYYAPPTETMRWRADVDMLTG